MLRLPHSITLTGYFEDLESERLKRFCDTLMEIERSPGTFFSLAESGYHLDTVDYRHRIFTEAETFQSDSTAPTILNEFVEVI